MQIANQRLRGIESLAEIGEKAAIDTIEAAIFYQSRLLDFQNSTIDFQKTNNDIASFNWSESYTPLEIINYSTSDSLDLYFNKVKNSFLKTLLIDTLNNPVLLKYNSLQQVLEIENRLKKEMIKPKLNVSYNFLSNENAPENTVLSTNNYKWGANISFPLLLRNSLNNYKMSKINSQNNNYELINKSNELNYKLNSLKQNINTLSEQLQNAERTARYSKQLVDAEKIKFTNGESSLFLLNTRENKWLESELKLAEYKLKFIKTVLNVIYIKGNLNYNF
jgi:outer membrane protein TolC